MGQGFPLSVAISFFLSSTASFNFSSSSGVRDPKTPTAWLSFDSESESDWDSDSDLDSDSELGGRNGCRYAERDSNVWDHKWDACYFVFFQIQHNICNTNDIYIKTKLNWKFYMNFRIVINLHFALVQNVLIIKQYKIKTTEYYIIISLHNIIEKNGLTS